MNRADLLNETQNTPLVYKSSLRELVSSGITSEATLNTFIQRSIKYNDLIQLKRGVYTPNSFYSSYASSPGYNFFIANKLIKPSYVSMQTALFYYGLLTETVTTLVTSVSRGRTKTFKNRLGVFVYKSIKGSLFTGFKVIKIDGFPAAIAEPYKAVFDILYYSLPKMLLRNKDYVLEYLDILRIDIELMSKTQRNKLFKLLKNV